MQKADLAIKNGFVVTPHGVIHADVVVGNGKILSVGVADSIEAEEVFDAGGKLVLPGVIDPHTHLGNEGADRLIEFMESESADAATGGVTTLSTTTLIGSTQTLEDYLGQAVELTEGHSYIDIKFTLSPLSREHLREIKGCRALGANTFKFFMGYKGEEAKYFGMPEEGITMDMIYEGFRAIAECDPVCKPMIHAEEPYLTEAFRNKVIQEDRQNLLAAWDDASPGIGEAIDIYKAALVAKEVGVTLYVVHVSSKEGVDLIRQLHGQDHRIIGETCLHYLVRTTDDSLGVFGKVKPPIRSRADAEAIWRGLRDGTITIVGTDSIPYSREAKLAAEFWDAPVGVGSSMALLLPIMFSEGVLKGRITLETLVRVLSENTARALGIYPQKGVLTPGSDADIVIFDPERRMVVDNSRLKTSSDFSIYDGMELQGTPVATFVRGMLVAKDYEVVSDQKLGKWLEAISELPQ